MKRWTLSVLGILMLAIAAALSNSALRLNATTRLQAFVVNIPKRVISTKPLGQTRISTISTSIGAMTSTSALPQDAAPEHKASLSGAEILASKSNAEPELPKLSTQDFHAYNRLAVMMDRFVSCWFISSPKARCG